MYMPQIEYGSKALPLDSVEELADGDLLLEGWAALFDGEPDRDGEVFDSRAFDKAISEFIEGTGALLFHHEKKTVLGRVLSLEKRPGGVWMRARVDGAIRDDNRLKTLYQQIKRGSIRSASVGGYFRRAGKRITAVDLVEVSLTATPVGNRLSPLALVGAKALGDDYETRLRRTELGILAARAEILRQQVANDLRQ